MAHNDHLKEPTLERVKGSAEGFYYKGVGAVMSPSFILVAPDMESLHRLWGRLTQVPLNEEATYPLAVFAQKDVR